MVSAAIWRMVRHGWKIAWRNCSYPSWTENNTERIRMEYGGRPE